MKKRIMAILLAFSLPLSMILGGCGGQGQTLVYDEFSVYTELNGIKTSIPALDATGGAGSTHSFAGELRQRYAQPPAAIYTKRGIGVGSTLEDFERAYGEVSFSQTAPDTSAVRPLAELLADIDPYGSIALQTAAAFEVQGGNFASISEREYGRRETGGGQVVLVRMNFLLEDGSIQDIQLFTKANF